MKSSKDNYEAVVIGGGPAGSTAASVLAGKGRRVLVLEKEKFPRYHIGESLMPYCYYTFERIGVLDKIKKSHFPKKYSVQFVRTTGEVSTPFYFFNHLKHEASMTWQVLRSEFDQMLLDNARSRGAEVREQVKVTGLIREGDAVVGVQAEDADGKKQEFRAGMVIDSSGREALSVTRHGWRIPDTRLKKVALWTYYRGALRDPGLDEGATTVAYLPEKGWFWYIPLPDNVVSVGITAEGSYLFKDTKDGAAIFAREIEKNAWIKRHVAVGERCADFRTTGDYSFRSRHCAANGLILAGDAFAFLDPVFSSGVFLALRSGEMAGEEAHKALADGDVSAKRFTEYGRQLCKGIEAMRNLVYAFYDHEFSFRKLFMKNPQLRGDVTDCLIGNLFIDFEPLFKAVSEFAGLPEVLPHGLPAEPVAGNRN